MAHLLPLEHRQVVVLVGLLETVEHQAQVVNHQHLELVDLQDLVALVEIVEQVVLLVLLPRLVHQVYQAQMELVA
jgi:hypothetical protein